MLRRAPNGTQRELALDSLEEGGEDEAVAQAAGFRSIARHDLRVAIVVVHDLFEDRFDERMLVLVHEHARIRPRSGGAFTIRSVYLRFARSVTSHRRSPAVAAERKTAPGGKSQGLLHRNPACKDLQVRILCNPADDYPRV